MSPVPGGTMERNIQGQGGGGGQKFLIFGDILNGCSLKLTTHANNFLANFKVGMSCSRDSAAKTKLGYNNMRWMSYFSFFWNRTKCWFVYLAHHSWCSLLGQVSMGNSECDYKKNCNCSTHEQGLRCKAGVNIITDGCACCSMCARQQGDLCNRKDRCDEHKGLKCEMILDGGLRGICRGNRGFCVE